MSDEEGTTPKPKPRTRKTAAAENTENSVSVAPDPTEAAKVMVGSTPAAKRPTMSGEDTDDVFLDRIVPRNAVAKKSLSVRHFQFRLAELGYADALVDSEGYYGDHVERAVAAFQHDRGMISTGQPDAETVAAVFENDSNVNLFL